VLRAALSNLILSLLLVGMWAVSARAEEAGWKPASCPKDAKVLAQELLDMELAGRRLIAESDCLEQKRFKYVHVIHEPSEAHGDQPELWVEPGDQVKLTLVKKQNEFNEYKAEFQITQAKSKKVIKDSFIFVMHTSPMKQAHAGCASYLIVPDKNIVKRECAPKVPPESGTSAQ
jgi:hypothetical protein